MTLKAIQYNDGVLTLLDQTKLPHDITYIDYTDYEAIAVAIEDMVVRGAPAIGITAAYGVVLGALQYKGEDDFLHYMESVIQRLANTRPTAINLLWALNRMKKVVTRDVNPTIKALETLAQTIFEEDKKINERIGHHTLSLIQENSTFITHCNPGSLATSTLGTATAGFYLAHEQGIPFKVFSDETRPRFQGALTAFELSQAGINVTTITDSTAASVLQQQEVTAVIVGCDRVALNGDVVNKIGTLPLAIAAKFYNVPFYVAAPTPTFDLTVNSGDDIPIEERNAREVTHIQDIQTAADVPVYNPAFDITPHDLITGLITEYGIIEANEQAITKLFEEIGG
ncbi:S-methyl-5-thioribose-1-phosphate isomerase [Macrococcoides caseolyticum]|uniref:S-methyl-5-thioribose-1-phosphate isomerase n=1 Tax=Macrococcoides caseolyticum TaxID=69966 RepID=UPI001F37595A|nr:S-methyl-5-thioribose-1-phosphate isomerase [Macrococcus caseolyticus]MCE4957762.1 S-methyl-5-thioribose-1-phosphate isomerase [Macrococcus caseolyticus]